MIIYLFIYYIYDVSFNSKVHFVIYLFISKVHFYIFLYTVMLGKGPPNVWLYDRYANVLSYHVYGMYSHGSWKAYSMDASHLVLPQ